jgi:hypothetical protein
MPKTTQFYAAFYSPARVISWRVRDAGTMLYRYYRQMPDVFSPPSSDSNRPPLKMVAFELHLPHQSGALHVGSSQSCRDFCAYHALLIHYQIQLIQYVPKHTTLHVATHS